MIYNNKKNQRKEKWSIEFKRESMMFRLISDKKQDL